MDKVTIRKATAADKEYVLRVNDNVYDGRDYVPAYYDHFLMSPTTLPVVMLYGNRIIAYVVGQIIDNGEAIVNRAGRIHPDFEAKGLSKRLNQYVYDWGLSRGVKKIVFTVSDGYPYLSKESFRRVTKHISTKQYPWYYFSGEGIVISEAGFQNASELQTMSANELSLYFQSRTVREYLSPEGIMIVDVVPYQMIDSNIPMMMQPKQYSAVYSDIKMTGVKCTGLLSFGLLYPTPRPEYTYRLDIFGEAAESLKIHILKHLIRVKEKTTGITAMLVYVSETCDLEQVDKVFEEFGILRYRHSSVNPKLKTRQIYAFEGVGEFSKM